MLESCEHNVLCVSALHKQLGLVFAVALTNSYSAFFTPPRSTKTRDQSRRQQAFGVRSADAGRTDV